MALDGLLDNRRVVHTPEGVALQLTPAGALPRALAWLVDLVIRLLLLVVLGLVLQMLGKLGMGLFLIGMFVLTWGYTIICEARYGATPGKRLLGLKVVAADGAPLGWNAAVVRNLLRTVDMLPFGYMIGVTSSLFDRHGRRLGDLVAGSQVIHAPATSTRQRLPDVPGQPLPQPLKSHEQALLLAFAERAQGLHPARRNELANLASPLTGRSGDAATAQLYALANGLLGRQ
jgi:uncharacterized RDD family membrane protein YckC